MGIGFIPFDKITGAGLADTTVDPTYFYPGQEHSLWRNATYYGEFPEGGQRQHSLLPG